LLESAAPPIFCGGFVFFTSLLKQIYAFIASGVFCVFEEYIALKKVLSSRLFVYLLLT